MNRRVGNTRCRVSPDDRLSIPKRWLRFDGGDTIKTFSKAAQMGGYLERIKSSRCCVSERNQVSWVGWARAVCESRMGLGPKQGTAGALFATASSHDLALLMARHTRTPTLGACRLCLWFPAREVQTSLGAIPWGSRCCEELKFRSGAKFFFASQATRVRCDRLFVRLSAACFIGLRSNRTAWLNPLRHLTLHDFSRRRARKPSPDAAHQMVADYVRPAHPSVCTISRIHIRPCR